SRARVRGRPRAGAGAGARLCLSLLPGLPALPCCSVTSAWNHRPLGRDFACCLPQHPRPDTKRATMLLLFPEPSRESPPMFESRLVDRFSRTHWSVVPILFVPGALFAFYMGTRSGGVSVPVGLLMVALGWLAWTLVEY